MEIGTENPRRRAGGHKVRIPRFIYRVLGPASGYTYVNNIIFSHSLRLARPYCIPNVLLDITYAFRQTNPFLNAYLRRVVCSGKLYEIWQTKKRKGKKKTTTRLIPLPRAIVVVVEKISPNNKTVPVRF